MSLSRSTFLSRAVVDPGLHRLNKLLGDVVISQGGVVPFINPEVRPLAHVACIVCYR